MKKIIPFILYSLFTVSSFTQNTLWTLEDCMEYAIQNSTVKNKQEAQNSIYKQNYKEAIAHLLPRIHIGTDANFNYGRSLDAETNIYTDMNSFSNNYAISSSIVLFDGFANITRIKLHKAIRLMGKYQLEQTIDRIAFETMEIFFRVLYYREIFVLAEKQWQESHQNLQRVKRMEELGLKSPPDVVELAAKEAADSYNITRQKNLLQIELIRLKEKMNFPINDELQLADYNTPVIISKIKEEPVNVYQHSLSFQPTVLVADAMLKSEELAYRTMKANLWPTLSANAGISTNFSKFMDSSEYIPFAEQFKNKRGYYFGFTLSIPLFDGFARVYNVKRGKQQLIIARNEREETLRSLYTQIEQAIADMNGQADEYNKASRQEEAMVLAHQLNLRKYEEGLISAIELHTSSNRLLQAQTEKINARLKYYIQQKLVNYFKGEPLCGNI